MSEATMFADSVLWRSGLGFLVLVAGLSLEMFVERRGLARSPTDDDGPGSAPSTDPAMVTATTDARG